MIISLGCRSPGTSCNLPGNIGRAALKRFPIWSCSRRGLPCLPCRHGSGELLPRHFTLTGQAGGMFLWHFPGVAPGSRYEPPCPAEFGLSSGRKRPAIMRPLRPSTYRIFGEMKRGTGESAGHGQCGEQRDCLASVVVGLHGRGNMGSVPLDRKVRPSH